MIRHFYIHTNEKKDPDGAFSQEVLQYLQGCGADGCRIRLPEEAARLREEADPETDCLLVLGGDGTVLRASHSVRGSGIPILGINLGHVGFLTEVGRSSWKTALDKVLAGNFYREERMLLEGRVFSGSSQKDDDDAAWKGDPGERDEDGRHHYALNDIVLARNGALRVIDLRISVDGQLLYRMNADGIVLSTPTGSTGYNYSAGGPIVQPTAQLILITPICPHTINSKSVVLSAEDHIVIELQEGRNGEDVGAEIYYDGISDGLFFKGDRVEVSTARQTVQLLRLEKKSFIQTVHDKMQP